jgi:hypothetical protein
VTATAAAPRGLNDDGPVLYGRNSAGQNLLRAPDVFALDISPF